MTGQQPCTPEESPIELHRGRRGPVIHAREDFERIAHVSVCILDCYYFDGNAISEAPDAAK
jgi:hypothetical protein